jgi:hypothetical protein
MNETELTQLADFLSIALEEMEHGNYEVAEDFVQDVYGDIQDEVND